MEGDITEYLRKPENTRNTIYFLGRLNQPAQIRLDYEIVPQSVIEDDGSKRFLPLSIAKFNLEFPQLGFSERFLKVTNVSTDSLIPNYNGDCKWETGVLCLEDIEMPYRARVRLDAGIAHTLNELEQAGIPSRLTNRDRLVIAYFDYKHILENLAKKKDPLDDDINPAEYQTFDCHRYSIEVEN